ncbi:MAG: hypothetical protein NXI23_00280 [Bacteroidetes bacterium]|jgi:hypothetical protein|nr:hypothetical protein [Bacteroidota bacterium]MDF1865459.1 hypothetical protein [Saprospiraceae bacterium]
MASEKSSNMKTWALFAFWTIVTLGMLVTVPQWFWLALPFMLTYLVQAMGVM